MARFRRAALWGLLPIIATWIAAARASAAPRAAKILPLASNLVAVLIFRFQRAQLQGL
jgi:hypothetical protein